MWSAFEVVHTPVAIKNDQNLLESVVVLDANNRVFVSSDPRAYPTTSAVSQLPVELQSSLRSVTAEHPFDFTFSSGESKKDIVSAGQILADDGTPLGTVLLSFDAVKFYQRLTDSLVQLALISIPGLVMLISLGWLWGHRMTRPITKLADAMTRVGKESPKAVAASLPASEPNEIGVLTNAFTAMLAELDSKESLEREVVSAERLAAVGRVAVGIAHEINNPLGGMLNAVDTLATHGNPDPFTAKTLALVRRGLNQIRTTVGALLVEARLDSPALMPDDWADLATLIAPEVESRGVALEWRASVDEALPLPAHQVRQLLLNLMLNAVKAAGTGGRVRVEALVMPKSLQVRVENSGPTIPAEAMSELFEPFANSSVKDGKRSYGIGLWVCYQIVTALGGTITVTSANDLTEVSVELPITTNETSTPCIESSAFA